MKKILGLILVALFVCNISQAQKLGYVDTQFILEKLEEYKTVKEEIDQLSARWQKELEEQYAKIEELYKVYKAEEILLPEEVKKERQQEIFDAERKAKEFKKEKFGYEGELYRIQDEKIRPIQDRVFEAVETVAKERKLNIILDKASSSGIIYSDGAYDRTDDVLTKLNVKK